MKYIHDLKAHSDTYNSFYESHFEGDYLRIIPKEPVVRLEQFGKVRLRFLKYFFIRYILRRPQTDDNFVNNGIGHCLLPFIIQVKESPLDFVNLTNSKWSIKIRGPFVPEGAKLHLHIQSEVPSEKRRTNWVYTALDLTPYILSEEWREVEFTLKPDIGNWTYCGHNLRKANSANYVFAPLHWALENVNVDVTLMFILVNPYRQPHGKIDIGFLGIRRGGFADG